MDRFDIAPVSLDTPLALPPATADPARAGFPLIASLAPVVGALALWAITGSPFALVFAVLGPIVAIGSMLDARRSARRLRRRASAERRRLLDELVAEIGRRHDLERAAAWQRSPSSRRLLDRPEHPAWREAAPPTLVLGRGAAASALRVDGAPVDAGDREVLLAAARLDDAPMSVDAGAGVGFVGELHLARAAARASVVQFAHQAHPQRFAIEVAEGTEGAHWEWLHALPHRGGRTRAGLVVVEPTDGRHRPLEPTTLAPQGERRPAMVVAVARTASQLPPGLGTIVTMRAPDAAVVRRHQGTAEMQLAPSLLGIAEAAGWAHSLAAVAERAGLGDRSNELPRRLELGELQGRPDAVHDRSSLAVTVGQVAGGALELDLARRGPHALVAGTTGSGKSEFLLAWIVALSAAHPPARVSFLLVDFKGGAAFEPVRGLPHVTGIVTDLDDSEAERAVLSLRAELTHRETVLARAGARDIAGLDDGVDLARLVIVVDEFQAMIERFPDLGAVIGDIAARGRSLGVHLVLASQRPNGVVREQVTANCPIRVSLRVLQRSDSEAVVGTASASEIPSDLPGRGVVDPGDGCPVLFHSAIATPAAIAEVGERAAGFPRARRTWLDPLPGRIAPDAVHGLLGAPRPAAAPGHRMIEQEADGAGIGFGVVDEPERQRRSLARWAPRRDGGLLVLGMPGSGRSTALAAIERASIERAAIGSGGAARVVAEPRQAGDSASGALGLAGPSSAVWDRLVAAQAAVRGGAAPPALVVLDDLDTRFRAWPEEYRHAAFAMVESLVREGRGRGVAVVASAADLHALGGGLREAFGARLLLRHATRSDLVQSGGRGELWRAVDGAGTGQWHGRRVQVIEATPVAEPAAPAVPPLRLRPELPYAVVAAAPRAAAAVITEVGRTAILLVAGGESAVRAAVAAHPLDASPPVIVGDSEAWAASWSLTAALREEAGLIVHGGAGEYRALVRSRELPPLLDDGAGQCWLLEPGRGVRRAIWPNQRNH
ncbi:S-DNA-T family DNA segregation ATPase FtsK/SpoIIIE [Agromyces hippuratus]|uniref:S-DNA-T family DNA segregation ATPase FtsK/SpoIIIE n=1 Tax=Agromyces hippuratus TaxID=286438 RepID=A0A852WWI6_9MICO|nr:FtsK/SpoIIIE domain-containing protein [Agromyces hippuratus]NYG19394.1 S-DNA-T family DNA segregation ATPase FtsK/SpoIIIE [Agromyces hippuratus]